MSSLPQQLPRPAVHALNTNTKNKETKSTTKASKTSKKKSSDLNFAKVRITPEQELELGRQIQAGVALHNLKTDFEATHGRDITRQEWTELAGLESPRELRKQVLNYRRAKQLLVSTNMGLVHAIVKAQYRGPTEKGSYDELIQEGSLGLLRAAELFDPSRGLRFSTYATIWIKGILSNSHTKETIMVPQREKTKWNKIRSAQEALVNELGHEPTPEQVAEYAGMTLEDVLITSRRMTQAKSVLSLDYEYSSRSRSGEETGSKDSALHLDKALMDDADLAERTQFHADVVAALASNLDAREARLMRLRYGLVDGQTRSIQECADAMGLSKTRVQQLAQSCLKKLREAADAEALQEYMLTIA
jgi:RNA polymerase primary sigma factor